MEALLAEVVHIRDAGWSMSVVFEMQMLDIGRGKVEGTRSRLSHAAKRRCAQRLQLFGSSIHPTNRV